jgi:acetamidase/formamidase
MHAHTDHTIHKHQGHYGWDNSFPPVLTVAPGTSIALECRDASCGQFTRETVAADVPKVNLDIVNPVTGPIAIDGAMPGDALKVTVLSFKPSGIGWTANIPGFGLLADQFPDPAIHHWTYDPAGKEPAMFGPGCRVPLKSMAGTIGVAPAEPGHHSIIPPRRVGGNMDVRDIGEGTKLYLPVEVAGGLFSLGDMHAAQGDGEVCGTAIETAMDIAVKLELVKGANLKFPRYTTAGPVTRHLDAKGYEVATGIGPDLMTGARDAVAGMIDLLSRRHGVAPVDAYILCSVCGDLRISAIVDAPNWVVSMYFPRVVFE